MSEDYKELFLVEKIKSMQIEMQYLQVRFSQVQKETQEVNIELEKYRNNKEGISKIIVNKDAPSPPDLEQ